MVQSSTVRAGLVLVVFWAILGLGGPALHPVHVDDALTILDRCHDSKWLLFYRGTARFWVRRDYLFTAGFHLFYAVLEATMAFRIVVVGFWTLDVADRALLFISGNLHAES